MPAQPRSCDWIKAVRLVHRIKQRIDRRVAVWRVQRGHAQRICAPGQWVVWREGDLVLSKLLANG